MIRRTNYQININLKLTLKNAPLFISQGIVIVRKSIIGNLGSENLCLIKAYLFIQ